MYEIDRTTKPGWLLVCFVLTQLVTLAPLVSVSADPPNDPRAKEIERLQGDWDVESFLSDGERTGARAKVSFRKSSYTMKFEPIPMVFGSLEVTFDFELDLSKDPREIRETVTSPGNIGFTRRLIYRLKGDTLEMCYHLDHKDKDVAPRTFDGKRGSKQTLMTLKRAKDHGGDKKKEGESIRAPFAKPFTTTSAAHKG